MPSEQHDGQDEDQRLKASVLDLHRFELIVNDAELALRVGGLWLELVLISILRNVHPPHALHDPADAQRHEGHGQQQAARRWSHDRDQDRLRARQAAVLPLRVLCVVRHAQAAAAQVLARNHREHALLQASDAALHGVDHRAAGADGLEQEEDRQHGLDDQLRRCEQRHAKHADTARRLRVNLLLAALGGREKQQRCGALRSASARQLQPSQLIHFSYQLVRESHVILVLVIVVLAPAFPPLPGLPRRDQAQVPTLETKVIAQLLDGQRRELLHGVEAVVHDTLRELLSRLGSEADRLQVPLHLARVLHLPRPLRRADRGAFAGEARIEFRASRPSAVRGLNLRRGLVALELLQQLLRLLLDHGGAQRAP